MAEQEVVKHTKKMYKIWNSKEHSLWYKAKEFILEILIIVFAVSLSIWFHGRSQRTHQEQEAKDFLLGLEKDLKSDISEMNADKEMFINSKKAFLYIKTIKKGQPAERDSIKKYDLYLFGETVLNPNNGRFEGFKSSGKVGTIGNLKLQNNIMDLYQEDIPNLIMSAKSYSERKSQLKTYFSTHYKRNLFSGSNYFELFSDDTVFYSASRLIGVDEIIKRYDKCISTMQRIIEEINKDYEH